MRLSKVLATAGIVAIAMASTAALTLAKGGNPLPGEMTAAPWLHQDPSAEPEIAQLQAALEADRDQGLLWAAAFLGDPTMKPVVRRYSALILGIAGSGRELDALFAVADRETDDRVRGESELAMLRIKLRLGDDMEEKVLTVLKPAFDSAYKDVRFHAAGVLKNRKSGEAQLLKQEVLSKESDPEVRAVLSSGN